MGRRQGFSLVTLSLYIIMLVISASFVLAPAGLDKHEDDALKDAALAMDAALSIWYQAHSGTYPENLSVLSEAKVLPPKFNLANMSYATQAEQTQYRLSVSLSSGVVWKSPGSRY